MEPSFVWLRYNLLMNAPVERNAEQSRRPLYKILAATLEADVLKGKWKPGDRLPTEAELMKIHEMSRATIRHALDILRFKRLIETFPNRGSIVLDRDLGVVARNLDTIEDLVRFGQEMRTDIFEWKSIEAAKELREFFGARQPRVYRLLGVRRRNDQIVYFIRSHVLEEFGSKIPPEELAAHTPIEIIRNTLHVPIVHATEDVWAERADSTLAHHLQVSLDSMLIVEEIRVYGRNSVPLQLATSWWRPDQYRRRYKVTS